MKKLIIFYSLDGNTKLISENIAEELGADILELKPLKEITRNNFMKMFSGGKQAMMKSTPELVKIDKNVNEYDTIFIGTPVWAWTFAPALRTFFRDNKIINKNIGLFACHGGGPGKVIEKMEEMLEGNKILGSILFKDPIKHEKDKDAEDAKKWARGIIDKLQ